MLITVAAVASPARDLLETNPHLKQLIAEANAASGANEVLRLTAAGVDSAVIQKFVENSERRYSLSADEIVTMHRSGVASGVITAMLRKHPPVSAREATPPVPVASTVKTLPAANPSPQAATSVIYIPNSPRPVRVPYLPGYYASFPRWAWDWNWGFPYGNCGLETWNYRPAWSFDFRYRGCW